MTDWRVELEPRDARHPDGGGTLEVLSGDEADAIDALEGWAATLDRLGYVPDNGLDWRNRSGAAVVRRQGRRSFAVRVDCFEFETETGYSNGAGWLRVREAS